MRVIVCGSRTWTDRAAVEAELEYARGLCSPIEPIVVVHGACPRGADLFAAEWVKSFSPKARITEEPHPADWKAHGRGAGMRRNVEMAQAGAELCLAFWDGESRGTQHMIQAAIRAGIQVLIVPPERSPNE